MSDFDDMRTELETFDARREELIVRSRKLLTVSKQAIYHAHREEYDQAQKALESSEELVTFLLTAYNDDQLGRVGAVSAALQEFVEAKAYVTYVTQKRLLTRKESGLGVEDYLLSLCDLSGELTRRAVLASIQKDIESVKEIRLFVDDLLGEFLRFNFRNGELRKKTDQIRWNVQKIEELLVKSS